MSTSSNDARTCCSVLNSTALENDTIMTCIHSHTRGCKHARAHSKPPGTIPPGKSEGAGPPLHPAEARSEGRICCYSRPIYSQSAPGPAPWIRGPAPVRAPRPSRRALMRGRCRGPGRETGRPLSTRGRVPGQGCRRQDVPLYMREFYCSKVALVGLMCTFDSTILVGIYIVGCLKTLTRAGCAKHFAHPIAGLISPPGTNDVGIAKRDEPGIALLFHSCSKAPGSSS